MNLIVSSPCAGRTWLLSILADCGITCNYSHVGSQHFETVSISNIEKYILNTYRNDNIVCLHREIKDHMVSKYHHCVNRVGLRFDNISSFIRAEEHGVEKLIRFNLIWKTVNNVQFITYENLTYDTLTTIHKVSMMFGYSLDDDSIQTAINNNSFGISQAKEISDTKITNPEALKARRGIVGGYVDYLSPEDIQYIDDLVTKYDYVNRMNA